MRFESVHARAFGPLRGQSMDLSPGLNVVWGPNEAGKSSWHAALYAGLCGMRRSRGKPTSADQEFAERHRPWDGDGWEVGATVRLEDGRRVELRHDLAGRVDSRATDADLGRDCSAEIIVDGAPDGSRWLGLDRRSFAATACVRQADLLSILDKPDLLQDELQRAAATGGADATAAAALARLEQFRSEHVGRNIATAVRPLRRSHQALESARDHLETARREHSRFVTLAAQTERHESEIERLTDALRTAERQRAHAGLQSLKRRHAAALELADDFPAGPPVVDPAHSQLVREVAEKLEAWRQQPAEPELSGPTLDELRVRLDELDPQTALPAERPVQPANAALPILGSVLVIAGVAAFVAGQAMAALLLVVVGMATLGFCFNRRRSSIGAEVRPDPSTREYRQTLRREIERREQDEIRRQSVGQQRRQCWEELTAIAEKCGLSGVDEPGRAARLEQWLDEEQQRVEILGHQARRHADLAHQQGQESLQELEAQIESAYERLQSLAESPGAAPHESTVEQLEQELEAARVALANLQGQRKQLETSLPGVAEAEERCAAAEAELGRVQQLDSVLATTHGFLSAAQERAHRDIAPVLADVIRFWIGPITHGRYSDARVDPASLEVRVQDADGRWRDAALLSHGTAEQIYLLLRVALAQHLTRAGEICPLILDDVTAHCDDERTEAVLEALNAISRERQVILFSQESQVRAWAEAHLVDKRDRLEVLGSGTTLV